MNGSLFGAESELSKKTKIVLLPGRPGLLRLLEILHPGVKTAEPLHRVRRQPLLRSGQHGELQRLVALARDADLVRGGLNLQRILDRAPSSAPPGGCRRWKRRRPPAPTPANSRPTSPTASPARQARRRRRRGRVRRRLLGIGPRGSRLVRPRLVQDRNHDDDRGDRQRGHPQAGGNPQPAVVGLLLCMAPPQGIAHRKTVGGRSRPTRAPPPRPAQGNRGLRLARAAV